MKNIIKSITILALALSLILCFAACDEPTPENIWDNATYTEDTELGEGDKTLIVEVKVEEHLVKFTVHTDKTTVGAALLENELIAGEDSQYGLYLKSVNGITADYDVDKHYWAFYIDGEYAMSGVDTTDISEGVIYRLEYAR